MKWIIFLMENREKPAVDYCIQRSDEHTFVCSVAAFHQFEECFWLKYLNWEMNKFFPRSFQVLRAESMCVNLAGNLCLIFHQKFNSKAINSKGNDGLPLRCRCFQFQVRKFVVFINKMQINFYQVYDYYFEICPGKL